LHLLLKSRAQERGLSFVPPDDSVRVLPVGGFHKDAIQLQEKSINPKGSLASRWPLLAKKGIGAEIGSLGRRSQGLSNSKQSPFIAFSMAGRLLGFTLVVALVRAENRKNVHAHGLPGFVALRHHFHHHGVIVPIPVKVID
jgi:hypothetical protein